jgi:hypothetical protein
MAVITFDVDKKGTCNSICVLAENTDVIRFVQDNTTTTSSGDEYLSGKMFINGATEVCIIRGERK